MRHHMTTDLREVLIAEPFRPNAMSSMGGDASYMYLRQYEFPHRFNPKTDKLVSADSDRLTSWDWEHSSEVCTKHFGVSGSGGLPYWCQQQTPEEVLAFCKDIHKADPEINWTGFRILATVNPSNGYTITTIELFAKGPDSKTKVYTGSRAPNIQPGGWNGYGYRPPGFRSKHGNMVYIDWGAP